jgi:hypothetical protein
MTPELIAAAVRLADTLAQENRALTALDLPRAAGMLEAKTRALEAFAAAQILAERASPARSRPTGGGKPSSSRPGCATSHERTGVCSSTRSPCRDG